MKRARSLSGGCNTLWYEKGLRLQGKLIWDLGRLCELGLTSTPASRCPEPETRVPSKSAQVLRIEC